MAALCIAYMQPPLSREHIATLLVAIPACPTPVTGWPRSRTLPYPASQHAPFHLKRCCLSCAAACVPRVGEVDALGDNALACPAQACWPAGRRSWNGHGCEWPEKRVERTGRWCPSSPADFRRQSTVAPARWHCQRYPRSSARSSSTPPSLPPLPAASREGLRVSPLRCTGWDCLDQQTKVRGRKIENGCFVARPHHDTEWAPQTIGPEADCGGHCSVAICHDLVGYALAVLGVSTGSGWGTTCAPMSNPHEVREQQFRARIPPSSDLCPQQDELLRAASGQLGALRPPIQSRRVQRRKAWVNPCTRPRSRRSRGLRQAASLHR